MSSKRKKKRGKRRRRKTPQKRIGGGVFEEFKEREFMFTKNSWKFGKYRYRHIIQRLLVEFSTTALLALLFIWTYSFGYTGLGFFAFVYMAVVIAGFRFTGSFFNPTLTFGAIWVTESPHLGVYRTERIITGLSYIGVQLFGAFTAMILSGLLVPIPEYGMINFLTITPLTNGFKYGALQFVSMVTITLVFLSVSSPKSWNRGWLGFVMGSLILGLGVITGLNNGGYGLLNPALSIMTNIVNAIYTHNPLALFSAFMYFVVDMSAGFVAAMIYFYMDKSMSDVDE